MKTKIAKILGIVLTITLLSSLAMVAAPVTAAPGVNAWGAVAGPPIVTPSSLGILEVVESDGTIFASVYNGTYWSVWMSTDGGDTWDDTSFDVAFATSMGVFAPISDIVASPNYAVDGTIYVATLDGRIWRIKGEGTSAPFLMAAPESEEGTTAAVVFDLDLWFDGSFIWVMAATNLDVLVFQDAPLQYWRDQQLQITPIPTVAYEAAFAPDFATSSRMWAVVDGGFGQIYVTSTVSTGQWDDSLAGVAPMNAALTFVGATYICELDFPSNYSAANPIVYLAASGPGTGNLWEIRGGTAVPGTTQAIPLLLTDINTTCVEVSGNVILAGTQSYFDGGVLRSLNLGNTFNPATKPPTGGSSFEVEMAPGPFSPSEGVAYCASGSTESAFNISTDGGDTWNQTAWVDTVTTGTLDMAFSPVTASQPAFVITNGGAVDSLWRTDDITADPAIWTRVQVSSLTPTGLFQFMAVEYSLDGTTVMLYGMDLGGNLELWTSNDNGQTFNYWKTLQTESNEIADWIVVDNVTLFAAVSDGSPGNFGFLGTTLLGTDKERLPGVMGVSIALQPGFDAGDADNSVVILGDDSGNIYISDDAGETWGAAQSVAAVGTGNVYVAFDADFANNGHIYFATSASAVGEAALNGNTFSGSPVALLDDSDDSATAASFSGVRVSPDNALYAIGGDAATSVPGDLQVAAGATIDIEDAVAVVQIDEWSIAGYPITEVSGTWDDGETFIIVSDTLVVDPVFDNILQGMVYIQTLAGDNGYIAIDTVTPTGLWAPGEDVTAVAGDGALVTDVPLVPATSASTNLFRLLLWEDGNMWETAASTGAMGLWVTEGSNYVWTMIGPTPYGLQDTLSGPVQGVTVSSIGETKATVGWNEMVGSSLTYEYDVNPTGTTEDTSVTVSGLSDNTDYEARVRVATQMVDSFPWSSRWSSAVDFTTLEAIAVPIPRVPAQGLQGAPLLPSFVWDAVSNAVSYDFELSTDPSFATTIVSTSLTITGYTFAGPELAYDTDHYWRVRARSATGTISAWCTIQNFHTRVEVIVVDPIILPDPVTPQVTVSLPQPTVIVNVPDVIVESPDIIVDVPQVVTVTQPPQVTLTLPERDDPGTPIYIWVIVGIGAILTIAVIVLIIRTRRVV